MRPYSDINAGDVYKSWVGGEWIVISKNDEEKMVEIDLICTLPPRPIWKKNTDPIFNNRVLVGFSHNDLIKKQTKTTAWSIL